MIITAGRRESNSAGQRHGQDSRHAQPCPVNTRTYGRLRYTVSTCRKSTARIPAAWACRNCRQVGPDRRGAGSMPAARGISRTVDGATVTPSLVSSPWIRRYPHSGFSLASRTTRRAMLRTVGGRPGLRWLLVSYFLVASLRCQARSVAGVTGKISAQYLRGRSRASAANTPGQPVRTARARRSGAGPRSRAGALAAQLPSPRPRGTSGQPSRVPGEPAGRRS